MHVQTSSWPPRQGKETCRYGDTLHVIFLNISACYTRLLIQLVFDKKFFTHDYVTSTRQCAKVPVIGVTGVLGSDCLWISALAKTTHDERITKFVSQFLGYLLAKDAIWHLQQ